MITNIWDMFVIGLAMSIYGLFIDERSLSIAGGIILGVVIGKLIIRHFDKI